MPIGTAAALLGGSLLSGIAGASGNHSSSSTTLNQGPASELESRSYESLLGQKSQFSPFGGFSGYQNSLALGPGDQDITGAVGSQRNLAGMYQQYAQTGGLPGQQDIATAQGFANDIFSAQRLQLQQNFQDQQQQYNRQLSASGRGINDPVYNAKMMQEQTRQQQLLGSQQGSYASQMALALPGQRLQYATQGNDISQALSQQAMQNRATILGMGSQLMNSERQYRLQSAGQTQQGQSGGGFGGFLSGALGGATAGLGIMNGFQALGKGTGTGPTPWGGNPTSGPNFMGPSPNSSPQPSRYWGQGPVGGY